MANRYFSSQETKSGTFTTKRNPVGFALLSIDDDRNLPDLYNLIVSSIVSGNVVYLSIKKGLASGTAIHQFIDLFSADPYFKEMLVVDDEGVLLDQRLKDFVFHGSKQIGSYIKYSEVQNFGYSPAWQHGLFTCKTVFKPRDVTDNTV